MVVTFTGVHRPYSYIHEVEVPANTGLLAGRPLLLSPMDLPIAAIQVKGEWEERSIYIALPDLEVQHTACAAYTGIHLHSEMQCFSKLSFCQFCLLKSLF